MSILKIMDKNIKKNKVSRRGKLVEKNRKNARKMEENFNFIIKY